VSSLKGFGIQFLRHGIVAAGSIMHYLDLTEHNNVSHITSVSRIEGNKYVWLDKFTIRNLELFTSLNEGAKTLMNVMDNTISPMGARKLKRWIVMPLKNIKPIMERHDIVQYFIKNSYFEEFITEQIGEIGDLERIISKVAVNRINPREIVQLKRALNAIEPIQLECRKSGIKVLKKLPANSIHVKVPVGELKKRLQIILRFWLIRVE